MGQVVGWRMLHVDLQQGIPDLPGVEGRRGIYVVLWWGAIALGHCEIVAGELPLRAVQWQQRALGAIAPAMATYLLPEAFLAPLPHDVLSIQTGPDLEEVLAIAQPWQQLEAQSAEVNRENLAISVVVCTRDRPEQLRQCVRSLQSLKPAPQEIVVVDNAPSSTATQQVISEIIAEMEQSRIRLPTLERIPEIHYVKEPRPGLDIARNTGIQHSQGDIVVFTDDDVQVHFNWLNGVRRAFQDESVEAMTGLVLPVELETEAQELFEKYWSFSRGYQTLNFDADYFQRLRPWGVPAWCVGAGANMAFRRSVLERLGGFDQRLDVGAAGCSGDSELWYRVMAAGGTCRYEPTAVVFHQHRRDLESLKRQMFSYMRGHTAALLIQFEKTRDWGNLRRLFWLLPKYYAGLLRRWCLRGFESRYCTLFREIKGCFSGVWFYGSTNFPGSQFSR